MKRRRLRSLSGVLALAAAAATLLALPVSSLGGTVAVNQVLQRVTNTVRTVAPSLTTKLKRTPRRGASSGGGARTRGGTPSSPGGFQPALHGTSPHGQGSVAVLDLAPSNTRPLGSNPSGQGAQSQDTEEVVAGRARGEQRTDGTYHGHITIAALLGNELLGVDTGPGQSAHGPLNALQQSILNGICNGSSQQICLTLLQADSDTTSSGSTNKFAVATAKVGSLNAGVAQSNGNISGDSSCQTSHGDSRAANLSNGGQVVANAASTSTDSRSCSDGSGGQTNKSQVLGLGGSGVPIPAPGCGAGTPDTLTGIPTLLPIVCNADDTNGVGESVAQAAERYGVRDALDIFGLSTTTSSLLKTGATASESRAVAPPAGPSGPPTKGPKGPKGGKKGKKKAGGGGGGPGGAGRGGRLGARAGAPQCSDGIDNDGDGKIDFPADPQCTSPSDNSEAGGAAAAGAGRGLAFTGSDVLLTLLLGALALGAGLRLRQAAGRPA